MKAEGAGKAQQRSRRVLSPVARRLWNIEVKGLDRLPADGPAILCPNHISFLDSAFLMLVAPRNISFVGKAEYMDSWKTKFLFPMMGMIPIDRSEETKAKVHSTSRVGYSIVESSSESSPRELEVATVSCTRAVPVLLGLRQPLDAQFSRLASWAPT